MEVRILIWIARKFTEEHRQAFDYLNECTAGGLRLYGVEGALGAVDWKELPESQNSRIVDYLKDINPSNRSECERGFQWLKKRADDFRPVF